jgi:hypothetical protein
LKVSLARLSEAIFRPREGTLESRMPSARCTRKVYRGTRTTSMQRGDRTVVEEELVEERRWYPIAHPSW